MFVSSYMLKLYAKHYAESKKNIDNKYLSEINLMAAHEIIKLWR